MRKVEVKFNTLGGQKVLTMSLDEALKSELRDAVEWLLSVADQGIVGGTFNNIKDAGRVEINLIKQAQ